MFTGLIESIGHVSELAPTASGLRLRLRTSLAAQLHEGDSVAVNGVCLTVASTAGGMMEADIGPETARITTLGSLGADAPVNLERSLRADGRLGGHFVQGHVDGTGIVKDSREDGDSHWLRIELPQRLSRYVVGKGSIAIDGISLTVAELGDTWFDVMIVPFTWGHTNLHARRVGDRVNLECDMVGKYVVRAFDVFETGRLNAAPTSGR